LVGLGFHLLNQAAGHLGVVYGVHPILSAAGPALLMIIHDADSWDQALFDGFVQSLRREDLEKKPGVAEMLDFAAALAGLGVNDLTDDPLRLQATLATLLKTQGDRGQVPVEVAQRLAGKAA
jgi:hypothetical protein